MKKIYTIAEDVRLPGTKVILEKGDRIQVIKEAKTFSDLVDERERLGNSLEYLYKKVTTMPILSDRLSDNPKYYMYITQKIQILKGMLESFFDDFDREINK